MLNVVTPTGTYRLGVPVGVSVREALDTTALRVRAAGRRMACQLRLLGDADVLNRLAAAAQRPERAVEIATLARVVIVDAVRDILKRDVGEVTPMLAEIGAVHIVGNTAMLVLLSGEGIAARAAPGPT